MRKLVFATLRTAFATFDPIGGASARVYEAGSLGAEDIPADPEKLFMIVRELPSQKYREVKETSRAKRHTFQLWTYDYKGSYTRIDDALELAELAICSLTGVTSTSGNRCLGVDWLGSSQDFTDDQYEAGVRYGNFQISASR